MAEPSRFRFAPSPTGFLHVGNARAALFNWLEARRTGGEFLLRVEDTDAERNQMEAMASIVESMRWLGLDWDGEIVFQAHRLDEHRAAAHSLLDAGRAYWCDCTAEQVQARTGDSSGGSGYDAHCRERRLAMGPGTALRFIAPDDGTTSFTDLIRGEVDFDNATIEDFVLLRSSGMPVFLLSNAVDDAFMGITHVVRGEDHVNGTPKYLLIREALGLGRPRVFAHLPLLVNEQRKKLSKRRDSVSIDEFRQRGYLAEAMRNYLALLGWGPKDDVEIRPIDEIVELFRLADVNAAPAFFDPKKLEHVNAEYIRALDPDAFIERVTPFLEHPDRSLPPLRALAPLVQQRTRVLTDAEPIVDFLYEDEVTIDDASWSKAVDKAPEAARAIYDAVLDAWDTIDWDHEQLADSLWPMGEALGLKKGPTQAPVRVAVTGRTVGPPLFEALEYLGREETLRRVRAARERLD